MMNQRTWMLVLVLLATPIISGGNCTFSFGSGGGSDDDDERKEQADQGLGGERMVADPIESRWESPCADS